MNLANNKISLLVQEQLPEFIQEEYPQFVRFIEAYYEFLENKQPTANNDLYTRAKELIDITDVDKTLEEFEQQFFNTYLQLFPSTSANTEVSKEIIIKNSIPFYLAKGNEKSFKYFFKSLFDEDISIEIPKNSVLVVSGGKWISLKTLRVETRDLYAYYNANTNTYNGNVSNTVFYLPQTLYSSNVRVFADGTQLPSSSFYIQREYKKITLNNPINSQLKIYIENFDKNLLINRKITGSKSGASAIIESVHSYKNSGVDIFEFEIKDQTINGSFINGESFLVDILNNDGSLLKINLTAFSGLRKINVINGGNSYNIGDQVPIYGGEPTIKATAIVSDVYKGVIDKMDVAYGGAGFTAGFPIEAYGISPAYITSAIVSVDTTGANSANSYTINNNLIWDLSANTISSANYRQNLCFSASTTPTIDANTRLIDAFSYTTINNIGPITKVYLLTSNANTNLNPTFDAYSANTTVNSTQSAISPKISVLSDGAIGRIDIISGGTGYKIGDKLDFIVPPGGTGFGARGAVTSVDSSGIIKTVKIQPYPPSANSYDVSIVSGSDYVTGNNSVFLDDFRTNQQIVIFNQERIISSIISNTSMRVSSVFDTSKSNTEIGLYNSVPLGGQSYTMKFLPEITVNSSTGIGASILATSIMGDGEILLATGLHPDGEIQTIEINDYGTEYKSIPRIDLSTKGSGTAKAEAEINYSYYQYPGKYFGTDGFLSSDKKIQDSKLYNTGTYIIKTKQQFQRFKTAILNLLHPAGSLGYCQYTPKESVVVHKVGGTKLSSSNLTKGIMTPILDLNFLSGTLDSRITFTRTGTSSYFNSSGILTSAAANVPRFDYDPITKAIKGLLIEEAKTNYIRNNTAIEAVIGSPGTNPTFWTTSLASGLSKSIIRVGTVNGISYVDIKIYGSVAAALDSFIYFEAITNTTTGNNVKWAGSFWAAIVDGNMNNVSTYVNAATYNSNATSINNYTIKSSFTPTDQLTRFSGTGTTPGASSAYIRPGLLLAALGPGAVDITLRIGLPQFELESTTSVIPTTGYANGIRGADTAAITTLSPWFNNLTGTLYAEWLVPGTVVSGTYPSIAAFRQASAPDSSTNSIEIFATSPGGNFANGLIRESGVDRLARPGSSLTTGSKAKAALAFEANNMDYYVNGVSTGSPVTTGSIPSVQLLRLGTSGTAYLNSHLRRVSFYNVRLGATALQSLTS